MSILPIRIQLSRKKGWRLPANTAKVDRTTKWGNPFVVGQDGTQTECVELYAQLLSGLICISGEAKIQDQQATLAYVKQHYLTIRGKNLACWCKPEDPCHADVLLLAVNAKSRAKRTSAVRSYVEALGFVA